MRKIAYVLTICMALVGGLFSFGPKLSVAQEPIQRTRIPRIVPGNEPPGQLVMTPIQDATALYYPSGESVMVIVQLDRAPLAVSIQQTLERGLSLQEFLETINAEREQIQRQQRELIAILTAPPYNARLIGSSFITSNTIILEIDTSLIEQILSLPGVVAAKPARPGYLDNTAPSPGRPPRFGPKLN